MVYDVPVSGPSLVLYGQYQEKFLGSPFELPRYQIDSHQPARSQDALEIMHNNPLRWYHKALGRPPCPKCTSINGCDKTYHTRHYYTHASKEQLLFEGVGSVHGSAKLSSEPRPGFPEEFYP